jgi:hypothetical protein
VGVSAGQGDGQQPQVAVDEGVDLGVQPATGAPDPVVVGLVLPGPRADFS